MKFNRKCQMWRSSTKEAGRYAMHALRLEGNRLVATNGRALAVITVEREKDDTDGLIPADAVQSAVKMGAKDTDAQIEADGELVVRDATKEFRFDRPDGEFPKWAAVVPTGKPIATSEIRFNAKLLLALAQSIGAEKDAPCVRIEFRGEGKPMKVFVDGGDDSAFGVLMPITVDAPGNPPAPQTNEAAQ